MAARLGGWIADGEDDPFFRVRLAEAVAEDWYIDPATPRLNGEVDLGDGVLSEAA